MIRRAVAPTAAPTADPTIAPTPVVARAAAHPSCMFSTVGQAGAAPHHVTVVVYGAGSGVRCTGGPTQRPVSTVPAGSPTCVAHYHNLVVDIFGDTNVSDLICCAL